MLEQKISVHVLDIHLFVEALAFTALHIDPPLVLPPDQLGFEKILLLIEKMSVSDGLKKLKRYDLKSVGQVEKLDLMSPFRKKYAWYFEAREKKANINKSSKSAFKQLALLASEGKP